MVQVNGKNFDIYSGATFDNIIQKLAKNMHTLPHYIYFPNGIPNLSDFYADNNFIVENLLESIKIIAHDSEVHKLFGEINPKLGQQNLSFNTDVLQPFIVYNKYLINLDEEGAVSFGLLYITTQLNEHSPLITGNQLNEIWKGRDRIRDKISKAIAQNSDRVDRAEEEYLILFEAAKKHWVYTGFELERINFEVHFSVPDLSVVELFNYVQLTPYVPFACINNIYKILKDFVPEKEWAYKDFLDDIIIFKVLQRKELTDAKLEDYVTVIVEVREESSRELVVIDIALDINKQYLSQEDFIHNFLQVLKIDVYGQHLPMYQPLNIQENSVKGAFYFPHRILNKYILTDLVLNNPHFSNVLAIDESSRATKKKDSVYVHFYNEGIGHLTANITQKISEKGDPTLKGGYIDGQFLDKDIQKTFKYGSYYIRVKISKADNQEAVKHFQELLSTLLAIYTDEEPILLETYKTLLKNPTFGKVAKLKSQAPTKDLRLGEIAPEVFASGYPQKCGKEPTIISDDQVAQAEREGKKVLVYPRTANEGFPQRNYICENAPHIYPGLRNNPLSNKNLVPYLPCCYEKDHSTLTGKPYGKYYNDEVPEEEGKVTAQQNFIITYKLARHNIFGKLLDNLGKIFEIINEHSTVEFVRKGVSFSPNSFLECVLEGLDSEFLSPEFNILQQKFTSENERVAFLNNIRTILGNSLANISSCRQECYDDNLEGIQAQILNLTEYLDPHLFVNLLETYFDCNIYVFSRPQYSKQTELRLPRHLESYYQTPKKGKCIIIYEHWGSKSDHSMYPHCELVVEWEKTPVEKVEYSFANNSHINQAIQNMFNKLRQSYALNNKIPLTIFPTSDLKFIGQGIDSYGKCRMLQFMYKDIKCNLLLSPIQPLAVEELINWTIIPIEAKLALSLSNHLNLKELSQNVVHNKVKSYSGVLGNVKVTIPIIEEIPNNTIMHIQGVGVNYVEQENSSLENYNNYKKLARYITSYVFWLYSLFLHQQTETISLASIHKFTKKSIEINPNFLYGKVGKVFSMQSGVMLNDKLVVKSEETLKRLIYSLRVFAMQEEKLLVYYRRKVIDNYYADVTDFDTYPGQVILQGENAIDNWILHQKQNYYLYNTVQFSFSAPYFFKNKLIGEDIWLAQNTFDINKAIEIAQIWLTQHYNPGQDPEEENLSSPKPSFTLYSYKSSTSIAKHIIGDSSQADSIKIIGYKIEGDNFFTVLLPL